MAMEKLPLTLCMERGPKEGQEFDGTHLKRVNIGRTRTSNYPIKDPTVSQKHAVIEWKLQHWTLVDVGSSNGTAVNGTNLEANEPVQIKNGDVIRFGDAILVRVQIEDDMEEKDDESEGDGVTVEEWFGQEIVRMTQSVIAQNEATNMEMKETTDYLCKSLDEMQGCHHRAFSETQRINLAEYAT